eukprot:scaffold3113_cov111-Skeletonema_dohrnii-CCMP3373.AAC.1
MLVHEGACPRVKSPGFLPQLKAEPAFLHVGFVVPVTKVWQRHLIASVGKDLNPDGAFITWSSS